MVTQLNLENFLSVIIINLINPVGSKVETDSLPEAGFLPARVREVKTFIFRVWSYASL